MAVSLYFGLPGAGKTTMMVRNALKAVRSKTYRHIYCNIHIAVPGVTYIDNDCVGKYDLSDCLILIDEATLFADNRAHKEFGKDRTMYFLEHRHFNADIQLYTQQWDGVDKKIRVITDRVYYVYKGVLLGRWFTRCYRIPYGIIIPDPKKDGSEKLGEIVQGYAKPSFIVRLFSPWMYRPAYYKYFDSWERPYLPPLPDRYATYVSEADMPKRLKDKIFERLANYTGKVTVAQQRPEVFVDMQSPPSRKAKLQTKWQQLRTKLRCAVQQDPAGEGDTNSP